MKVYDFEVITLTLEAVNKILLIEVLIILNIFTNNNIWFNIKLQQKNKLYPF